MLTEHDKINVTILRKLYKGKIKNITKLHKSELFLKVNEYIAVKTIQKAYRSYFYKNAEDCITLEKVSYPCFIYRTKFGKLYFYSYDSIIKYIMKTGDVRDPMTRTAYSDNDLLRLDLEAKIYFPHIKYKSTLKIKKNPNYAKRIRNQENEILAFQLRLDELKNNILFIIHAELFSWNIPNEPILIDNIEYRSISVYIVNVLYEFKVILTHLGALNQYQAESIKMAFIEELETLHTTDENVYEIIESIKKIQI